MPQMKASHASVLSNITNKTGTSLVGLVTKHMKSVEMLIALPPLIYDKSVQASKYNTLNKLHSQLVDSSSDI